MTNQKTKTDADIVREIHRNADRGFRMLVDRYTEKIYWHVRRTVDSHDDAQDVVQEVFIRIFKSLASLNSAESLRSWIYRIATNEALRYIERQRSEFTPLDDAAVNIASDPYVDYDDVEAVRLKEAIHSLPPRQQLTFNMRYYDELNYDEIAEVLGCSAGSVRANYHNAKEKIIKYMNSI